NATFALGMRGRAARGIPSTLRHLSSITISPTQNVAVRPMLGNIQIRALCDDGCVPIKPRDPLFQRNPGLLVEFVQFGEMQRVFALGSHGLLHFSEIDRLRSL